MLCSDLHSFALLCSARGAEKLRSVFFGNEESRLRKAVRQWQMTLRLMHNENRLHIYLRFTSCKKVMTLLGGTVMRLMSKTLITWREEMYNQQQREKDAAACEIQRMVRAFTAKRRVSRARSARATKPVPPLPVRS